jgi:hypothetical protein
LKKKVKSNEAKKFPASLSLIASDTKGKRFKKVFVAETNGMELKEKSV